MTALLDVNLLVALAWPNHLHHEAAQRWFRTHHRVGWATCPLTQSSFVRVSSNPRAIPTAVRPAEAIGLLAEMVRQPHHVFWEDAISLARSRHVAPERIVGHQQVTDAHLLALALRHKGKLATMDRGVLELLPPGVSVSHVVLV